MLSTLVEVGGLAMLAHIEANLFSLGRDARRVGGVEELHDPVGGDQRPQTSHADCLDEDSNADDLSAKEAWGEGGGRSAESGKRRARAESGDRRA